MLSLYLMVKCRLYLNHEQYFMNVTQPRMPAHKRSWTQLMTNTRTFTAWGLAVSATLVSPILVIFMIPLTIGFGLDIFELVGEGPFALALCAPVAFLLLRLIPLRTAARQLAVLLRPRLPLDRSGALNYAPKSIS